MKNIQEKLAEDIWNIKYIYLKLTSRLSNEVFDKICGCKRTIDNNLMYNVVDGITISWTKKSGDNLKNKTKNQGLT